MMQDKSKWVDGVLESTRGMAPATPRADLYGQLKAKMGKDLPKVKRISLGVMSAAAACLLVLLGLNIRVMSKYAQTGTVEMQSDEASVKDIVDYYELGSNNTGI